MKSAAVFAAATIASVALAQPFYPHYEDSTVQTLDGTWSFGFAEEHTIDPVTIPYSDIKTPNTTQVPSSFDVAVPGVVGAKGTGYYRTTVQVTAGRRARVLFAACSFYCRVFFDGQEAGDHRAGGYAPFWMDMPASSSKQTREILVLANNEFNSTRAPVHTGGDFYNYGGLTRNVVVRELSEGATSKDLYVQRLEVLPVQATSKPYTSDLRLVMGGTGAKAGTEVEFELSINAGQSTHLSVTLGEDGSGVVPAFALPDDIVLWAPGEPNLYVAKASVPELQDSITVRTGHRIISVQKASSGGPARLAVNGKITKLLGFNRHTMWPDTGSALTMDQLQADLAIVKELNLNYIRGAHYPQDQRWLDILDEEGIAIWEETLGPGVSLSDLQDPYFMKYQLQQVAEMVETSINHPSIIVHGFNNEGPSDKQAACPGYNQSANAIRERTTVVKGQGRPDWRLVTWASDKKTSDVCLAIVDHISFNDYPCWYGELQNCPNETTVVWGQHVEWAMQHYPDKSFQISETGAAGIYEWHNDTVNPPPRWSQAYQRLIVPTEAQFAATNPNISALTIWQFNDIKASMGSQAAGSCDYSPPCVDLSKPCNCAYISTSSGRPGGENHKGVVDFWRRTKEEFGPIAAIYKSGLEAAKLQSGDLWDGVSEAA